MANINNPALPPPEADPVEDPRQIEITYDVSICEDLLRVTRHAIFDSLSDEGATLDVGAIMRFQDRVRQIKWTGRLYGRESDDVLREFHLPHHFRKMKRIMINFAAWRFSVHLGFAIQTEDEAIERAVARDNNLDDPSSNSDSDDSSEDPDGHTDMDINASNDSYCTDTLIGRP
ncbi:hypothetical protein PSTG_17533 [Puccinia striiformis f. sp. tritici PST-78]|uniref:Uncharacterized protein n=1 Tax=Puccinia striiformis f. sp. tritici PST-78 TaxID=1165861 RepID=A0A0L0UPM5_9BASI|nr:hypothetical protein PSTG_17533 [Puccinia striiformis f. sp. tritici PST-78]